MGLDLIDEEDDEEEEEDEEEDEEEEHHHEEVGEEEEDEEEGAYEMSSDMEEQLQELQALQVGAGSCLLDECSRLRAVQLTPNLPGPEPAHAVHIHVPPPAVGCSAYVHAPRPLLQQHLQGPGPVEVAQAMAEVHAAVEAAIAAGADQMQG
jgi:hypothetical protein